MNRGAIRVEARLRTGVADDDPILSDSVINSMINASLRRVTVLKDWPWMEDAGTVATTANLQTIGLAAHRKVMWMMIDNQRLEYVPVTQRADFDGRTGRPYAWTEFAGTTYLLPTPDAVYTVDYGILLTQDPALSADVDVPRIPDWAVDLVLSDVAILMARRLRNQELERVHYAERERFRASIEDEIASGNHPVLPDRPLWRDVL